MPRSSPPQLLMPFARPPKKRGGLDVQQCDELITRLREDAACVALQFNLPAYTLDADRPSSTSRYGICFADGKILVRLVHATTGKPLRYSALIDTVVHELAHLKHLDHGPRWEMEYHRMLHWCRMEGIYEPAPVPSPKHISDEKLPAQQLGLFARAGRKAD